MRIPSFQPVLNQLGQHDQAITSLTTQLATGKRINAAKDDPAGLIAATKLSQSLTQLSSEIFTDERRINVLRTAEGGLSQIQEMLLELQGLVTTAAGDQISADEREAKQLEIDSLVEGIQTVINNTEFNGSKLLNQSTGLLFRINGANANNNSISDLLGYSSLSLTSETQNLLQQQTAEQQAQVEADAKSFEQFLQDRGLNIRTDVIDANELQDEPNLEAGVFVGSADSQLGVEADGDFVFNTQDSTGALVEQDLNDDATIQAALTQAAEQAANNVVENLGDSTDPDLALLEDLEPNALSEAEKGAEEDATEDSEKGIGPTEVGETALTNEQTSELLTTNAATIATPTVNLAPLANVANNTNPPTTSTNLTALTTGSPANAITGNLEQAQAIVENASRAVARERAAIGAEERSTESLIRAKETESLETTKALSEIEDADYAKLTSELVRTQTLQAFTYEAFRITAEQARNVTSLLEDVA